MKTSHWVKTCKKNNNILFSYIDGNIIYIVVEEISLSDYSNKYSKQIPNNSVEKKRLQNIKNQGYYLIDKREL